MNTLSVLQVQDTSKDRVPECDPLVHGEVRPVQEGGNVGKADSLLWMPLED